MDFTVHLKEQAIKDLKNLFPGTIMPDIKDLRVAELICKKLHIFEDVFTADEMSLLRKWVWEKRGGESWRMER